MRRDRQRLAELLTEHDAMTFVKEMAARFGDGGKLNYIAIITEKNEQVFVGARPTKTKKCQVVRTR